VENVRPEGANVAQELPRRAQGLENIAGNGPGPHLETAGRQYLTERHESHFVPPEGQGGGPVERVDAAPGPDNRDPHDRRLVTMPPHALEVAQPELRRDEAPQPGAARQLFVVERQPGPDRALVEARTQPRATSQPAPHVGRELAQPPPLRGSEAELVASQADRIGYGTGH